MTPFRIDTAQGDLDDLRDRLARTRWPRQLPGDGWSRGVPVDYLRDLVDYWRDGFDWHAQSARLNQYPQNLEKIDGLTVHFLHARSADPGALPLVLTHGWPNSVFEFADLIEPLTTEPRPFHVVVPSVPGFGFSEGPAETGMTTGRVGRMWAELMRRLGYDRYGAQGGDLGAYVAPEVAIADPDHVVGVYVNAGLGFPTEVDLPDLGVDERAFYDQMQGWSALSLDHHALLRRGPQTMSYGWHDSPAGLLAWQLHKFKEFHFLVDTPDLAIDRDLLLANATLYWLTGTEGSSSWPMYDTTAFAWPRGQKAVPTGVWSGPPGVKALAERHNTIVHWPEDHLSGHFVAMEKPAELAEDLKKFFAQVR